MPRPTPPTTEPGGLPVRLRWIVAAAVVGAFFWIAGGDPGDVSHGAPDFLVGRWATDAPRYAGRSLEITPEGLVFHRGEEGPVYHGIREVLTTVEEGQLAVHFHFRGPEGGGDLTVYLSQADSTRMTLQNRPDMIWRREVP